MMVAIPLAMIVERNDKQVGAGEFIQERSGTLPVHHGVAEGARHPAKHRGFEHEPPVLVGQTGQDLLTQPIEARTSSFPSKESTARYIPAGQPSVRSSSTARSSGPTRRRSLSFKRVATSCSVKARCSVRISLSSPLALSRPRCNGGSERVARTRCTFSGRCSTKKSIDS